MVGHSLDQGAALPLYLHYRLLPRATMGTEGQVDAQEERLDVRKDPQSNGNAQSNSDGE